MPKYNASLKILSLFEQKRPDYNKINEDDLITELDKKLFVYIRHRTQYYNGVYELPKPVNEPLSPIDHAIRLIRIELLSRLGEYDQARDLTLLVMDQDLDPYFKAAYNMNLALIYHDLGELSQSIELYQAVLKVITDDADPLRCRVMIGLADNYTHIGRYNRAQDLLTTSILRLEQIGHDFYLGYAHHIAGILFHFIADQDRALHHFAEAQQYFCSHNNEAELAKVHYSMADLYYSLGDYQLCRKHLDNARPVFEEIGNKRDYSFIFMLQALMLSAENLHDDAIISINQTISLLREIGNRPDLSSGYQIKGETLYRQGKYTAASEYVQRSLKIKEEYGNQTLIGLALFFLILIHQRNKNLEEADHYFSRLSKLRDKDDTSYLDNYYQAAKGYLLKSKNRLRYKVEALDIFQELKERESLEYDLRIFAMLNQVELLLLELKLFEKPEVIEEIFSVLSEINTLAEYNYHHTLRVEVNLFKVRLFLIQGQLNQAYELLTQLEREVEEVNNEFLRDRVNQERIYLEEELDSWKITLDQGASVSKLIETSQIQDYLQDISRRFDF